MMRIALLIWALLVSAPASAAEPTGPIAFAANLSADEQSVTTDSAGAGRIEFSLERDTLRLSWKLTYAGLTSPVTAAQVHGPQRIGANAGVQFDLGKAGAKPPIQGAIVLNDSQLQYLIAGWLYVNIHTVKYPDGELRGTIRRVSPATP